MEPVVGQIYEAADGGRYVVVSKWEAEPLHNVMYDDGQMTYFPSDVIVTDKLIGAVSMKTVLKNIFGGKSANGWIPVEERMPPEHASLFAKLYGTDNWRAGMFLKESNVVQVTIELEDGQRKTEFGSTIDGIWNLKHRVVAWKPKDEPYEG